jgi:hypothetical protein
MVEACNASFQVHLQLPTPTASRSRTTSRSSCSRRCWPRRPTRRCSSADASGPRRASPCLRAGVRHPYAGHAPARVGGARVVRPAVAARKRLDSLYRENVARFGPSSAPRSRGRPLRRPRRGTGPRAQGPAPPQRHRLPLEPRVLRHLRERPGPPAHRAPGAPLGAHHRRRGGQRRPLAGAHERARRHRRGRDAAHRLRPRPRQPLRRGARAVSARG